MLDESVKNKINNKILIKTFCDKLITEIKDNEKNINEVNKIDRKYYDKLVDIKEFIKIVESYKNKTEEELNKNILCIYNGNPEITLKLCLEAVLLRSNFIMNIQDFMVGVNKLLVELVNKVLKSFNTKLYLFNLLSFKEIKTTEEAVDKILCIGNTNEFIKLSQNELYKLDFYPYKSLEIYCEDDELEELQRMIYEYSMTNQYEIEVYVKDNFDNIIGQMNEFGNGFCSVLLSKNKDHIKKFKEQIQSDIICVNENPYNKIEFEIKKWTLDASF